MSGVKKEKNKEIERYGVMIEEKFIQKLIEKREKAKPEEIKEILNEYKEQLFPSDFDTQFRETIISSFTDKLNLAEKFYEIIPFFYDEAGIWWVWDSGKKFYRKMDDIDILNRINNSSPANTINAKERQEILQAMKQTGRMHKPEPVKKTWIQFKDYVVDIETGDRFQPTPEYFFTSPIPHNIGHSEETPTMDKLFEEWVGNDYVQTLYEIIAYSMLRDYPIERIFCFLGSGSNGKSCYMQLIRRFIGEENVVSSDLDLLIKSRFETSKLRNKLVCFIGETNFQNLENTSRIKRMTSGKDAIPIEYKNRGLMDYVNYAKLIMATNNLPPTSDKTLGWGRRWCIIDFPNQFKEEKDILSEILEEEYENLALKSITNLIELLKKRRFHNEGSMEERMKRYEEKSNPLEKFWKENVVEDYNHFIFKHDFRDYVKDWCREHRFREMSDYTIAKFMKEKGIESQRKQADFAFHRE